MKLLTIHQSYLNVINLQLMIFTENEHSCNSTFHFSDIVVSIPINAESAAPYYTTDIKNLFSRSHYSRREGIYYDISGSNITSREYFQYNPIILSMPDAGNKKQLTDTVLLSLTLCVQRHYKVLSQETPLDVKKCSRSNYVTHCRFEHYEIEQNNYKESTYRSREIIAAS